MLRKILSSTLRAMGERRRRRARSCGLVGVAFTLAASGACGGDSRVEVDLRVVSPSGDDPIAGTSADTFRVHYAQGDAAVMTSDVALSDGTFDVAVPAPDLNAETFIALELLGGEEHLVGALPRFTAVEAGFAATLVIGPAGACAPLSGVELAAPASGIGAALVGTYGLLVGGEETSSASSRIQYFDPLRATAAALDDAPNPLGRAQVAAITRQIALVLPSETEAFFYDTGTDGDPILEASVHPTARDGGVLVSLGTLGAIVAGGRDSGAPVADLRWVDADGAVTARTLGRPRAEPAVAFDGARLWVAGGESGGASSLELAALNGDGAIILDDLGDGERFGGFLFTSASGADALLVGGHDALGALRADTLWFHDCPSACTVEPGPEWTTAREGVVALASIRRLVGGEGAGEIERVDFSDAGPAIVAECALDVPRRSPAVLPIAAGVVVVLGGVDAAGPRRDAEICFPEELELP